MWSDLAGQKAAERSANAEAVNHFTTALGLLKIQPDTPQRSQDELVLQIALGSALANSKSFAVPEVEQVYTRARELCQQVGDTPQLFRIILGLRTFYHIQGQPRIARELAEQLLTLAQSVQDSALLVLTHRALGASLFVLGDFLLARSHLEQSLALYDVQRHRWDAIRYGQHPGVLGKSYLAWTLWNLGYPTQALTHIETALAVARELSSPVSAGISLTSATVLHRYRREHHLAQQRGEAAAALSTALGIPNLVAGGTVARGWALSEQGQVETGIAQMHEGLAAMRATGAELQRTHFPALLAETYDKAGQTDAALCTLTEALDIVNTNGECYHEAELYRLKGQFVLQSGGWSPKSEFTDPRSLAPDPQAEGYFLKAIDIAQRQQAKSLKLRAAVSLARLWQQQDKTAEAHQMLSEIYNWFTERFDTADLKEAKVLLEELA